MSDTDTLCGTSNSTPRLYISSDLQVNEPLRAPRIVPKATAAHLPSEPIGDGDWIRVSEESLAKHMSFVVPTARMVETPPRNATSINKRTPSKAKDKGKGKALDQPSPLNVRHKGKDPMDFQAEVDRTEMARDRADPDFDFAGPSTTPRKRRLGARTDPSPPTKKAKLRTRHIAYENCKSEDARRDRDRFIARIHENWKIPAQQWMPKSMVPSRKTNMRKGKYQLEGLDPRDWNGRLLAELSYFSGVTKNNHARAYKALQDSVSRKGRGAAGPQLLEPDVQYATQICEEANANDPLVAPANLVAEVAEEIGTGDTVNQATADLDLDDRARIPPPRSPTFVADDVVVKPEPRLKGGRHVESRGGWDGYDDEVEKLEELTLIADEMTAKRARFQQMRRLRELARQHGKSREDAILLRSHEDGE